MKYITMKKNRNTILPLHNYHPLMTTLNLHFVSEVASSTIFQPCWIISKQPWSTLRRTTESTTT